MRYFFALLFSGFCTSYVVGSYCWWATKWVKPGHSTTELDCPFWAHYCLCDPDRTPSERLNCVAFTWEVESNVPNYSNKDQEIGYSETQSVTLAEGGAHSVTLKKSKEVTETYEVGASVFSISLGAKSQTIQFEEDIDKKTTSKASALTSETSITKTKIVKARHRLVFYQIHYFLPTYDISWFFEKPETNKEQRIGAPIIEQVSIEEEKIIEEPIDDETFEVVSDGHQSRDPLVPFCDKDVCSIRKHLRMCVGSLPANKCRSLNSHRDCLQKDVKDLNLHENYLKVCEINDSAVLTRLRKEEEQLHKKNTGTSYEEQYQKQERSIDEDMELVDAEKEKEGRGIVKKIEVSKDIENHVKLKKKGLRSRKNVGRETTAWRAGSVLQRAAVE